MRSSYRVPVASTPIKPWNITLLWGVGSFIGLFLVSMVFDGVIFKSVGQINNALYPQGWFEQMLQAIDTYDIRSIVPAAVNFGSIGLFLGIFQLPAARVLKFKYYLLISITSWMLTGVIFCSLNLIMDPFMPYRFNSGIWLNAVISGFALGLIQVKFLKLHENNAFLWCISYIIGLLCYRIFNDTGFISQTFNVINPPLIIGWIPLLMASSMSIKYILSKDLENTNLLLK